MLEATPYLGVIEGFYGKTWSWNVRHSYASFLKQYGYEFYIYAPKADQYLRHQWFDDWPAEHWNELISLRKQYLKLGVEWGIGLSPFELYKDWGSKKRKLLERKVKRINELCPDILCVLFDDMSGDKTGLADLQIEITELVLQFSSAKRIIVCPTYYSFDPILEELFGPRPKDYWQTLGGKLPAEIDVFWTGSRVCSTEYDRDDIEKITQELQRKPFIWDNYPVNDGRLSSQFIHLGSFKDRPQQMSDWCAGHAVNPMNAAHLSKIALLTLGDSYQRGAEYDADLAFERALREICGAELAERLAMDAEIFQSAGLDNLSAAKKQVLLERYKTMGDPYSKEICQWLQGHFRFDPACLTE